MVVSAGFEPATFGLGNQHSIQLNYETDLIFLVFLILYKINIAKTRKKWKCFFDMDQCKYGSMQIWILVLYFLSIRKFELIIDASAISVNYV